MDASALQKLVKESSAPPQNELLSCEDTADMSRRASLIAMHSTQFLGPTFQSVL